MEQIVKELGFESLEEWQHLVSTVNISTQEKMNLFEDWKYNDGSKDGLLKLFEI